MATAQSVQYFVGQGKTLNKALLTDLFKGVAHISIMPFDLVKKTTGDNAGGILWKGLSFRGADELFTIKDSFQITQADPTTEEINVDQFDTPIDTEVTAGEWTFAGNVPTVAIAACDVFYKQGVAISAATQNEGILGQEASPAVEFDGQAYFAEPKEVMATMLVENRGCGMALAFARVKITVGLSKDDSGAAYLKMSGTILNNPEASGQQGDWAVCKKHTA